MRRLSSSVLGVIAVAAILVGLNALADRWLATAQLDLTQQHLYTLSSGTRQILRGLKEPITLRLFYSPQLGSQVPTYGTYADRVRELLTRYAALADGKIRLEFYNPEPFSAVEDRAIGYGLQGVPVDQNGEKVYFGLVGTNLLDDQKTVGFFQPNRERFLEYDLTRLIYELSNPTEPVVGVMSSLPLDGDPRMMMMRGTSMGSEGAPWVSMLELRQAFKVKTVPLDTQVIDPSVQVLVVAQAQHLSDSALYAIDQFVMRGGRLMVFVDPHSEMEAAQPDQSGEPPADTSSDLAKLFAAWGIVYDPTKIVGDLDGAWRVQGNPGDRTQGVDYVAWFNIRDGINHDDPATADLTQVSVASAGALSKKPGADITFTPLLSSSANGSALLPVSTVEGMPDPAQILAGFKPAGGARVIAARVHGVLKSAFTAPPPPPNGEKRPDDFPPYLAQSKGPANLVVVADSDILADRFWVRVQNFFGQDEATPFSDNGAFVSNVVGTLAGSDALLGLRGRGSSVRPFTVVDNMQRRAEAQFRQSEQALQTHLTDTEKKLADLRAGRDAGKGVVTTEQTAAIEDLQHDMTDTRSKLRAVQLDLRRDISRLEMRLRLFDILLVPAILALVAIVHGFVRSRRRARARA